MQTNLVVVAHPDDEILGFGATGYKLTRKGEKVQPLILCGNVEERSKRVEVKELHENIFNACNSLGFSDPIIAGFPNLKINNVDHISLVKAIEDEILSLKPKRIFTHHPNDLNDDHRQISRACIVASKTFLRKNINDHNFDVYFMEIQSSTEWSQSQHELPFSPNIYVDITDCIDKKINALKKYKNVMRDSPHPRSEKMMKALAAYRGSQSGSEFAESFELLFSKVSW